MPVAELKNICKQYPGRTAMANNNISLALYKGEILCIAGENGAGKTTLMKILSGLIAPSSGDIFFNGKKTAISSSAAAKKLGIGMLHQHALVFPEYTVAENITFGLERRKYGIFIDEKKTEEEAQKVISGCRFNLDPGQKVKKLSVGEMKQVEICRILYGNAQILIMDEPTAILTEAETETLIETIKNLAVSGKTIVFITHKLNEIKLACDRLAVLRNGELAGIRYADKINTAEIAAMMMGKPEENPISPPKKSHAKNTDKPVVEFKDVSVYRHKQKQPLLDQASFTLHPGEILGFTGVGGNGLGVLEAVLGGFLHPAAGNIHHNGADISRLNTRELRAQGLAYVPTDRLHVGSSITATVKENMLIHRRNELSKYLFLDKKAIGDFSGSLTAEYNILGDIEGTASALSGGNLQKLVLSREINISRDYIIFCEPTWSLDIASGNFIWRQIIKQRGRGAGIILISTNLDEIMALSDRIMVMYRGRISGEFANDGSTNLRKELGQVMQGLQINAK